MLDAIKRVIGRLGYRSDRLEELIHESRAEREALTAILRTVSTRGAEVSEVGALFAQVDRKADESTARLDGLAARLQTLESRATDLSSIDGRIQVLVDAAAQGQQHVERLMAPDGELQKHRTEVQRLVDSTAEVQSSASALRTERGLIEQCRTEIVEWRGAVEKTAGAAERLRAEVEELRHLTTGLSSEYVALRQASHDTEQDSTTAAAAIARLESRLSQVTHLREVSVSVDEKLAGLNALAEHVTQKTLALEDQKQTLDRALVEANRLDELVWHMDSQITKLRESLDETARTRDTLARVEALAAEAEQKLDIAMKLRGEFALDTARFEREGRALLETVRDSLERLGREETQLDVLDRRLGAIQTSLVGAEARMSLLSSHERASAEMRQQVDDLEQVVRTMSARTQEVSEQQAVVEALAERLAQVDALARQTSIRYDGLMQSRFELDGLRREILELRKAQTENSHLRERLASDHAALEALANRFSALRAQTPEVEAGITAVLARLSLVDEAGKQAQRLEDLAEQLDVKIARLAGRDELVNSLDARLNALQRVGMDVDHRLETELSRRVELETLRTSLDGAAVQMRDLLQTADGLQVLGERLDPLEERVSVLADQVGTIGEGLDQARRGETELAERRSRLEALLEDSRALAADTAERHRQIQTLSATLERSLATKSEILAALSEVEGRQRDALTRSSDAADHVARLEELVRGLEERRVPLAASEVRLAQFELRLEGLSRKSAQLETTIQWLAEREALVMAVRAEVEQIHQVGMKSRADLAVVSEHREEVSALRLKIDALLAAAADAEDKIAAIEGKHAFIDAVQAKTNLVANLLEDMRVTLDSVGEQKAVVDHVAIKIARLEFMMQEAQNTIRTLQHERELAQRIERQIVQLRGRMGPGEGTPAVNV